MGGPMKLGAMQGLSWGSPWAASLLSLLPKHPVLTTTGEKQNKLTEYSWQLPDTTEYTSSWHLLQSPVKVWTRQEKMASYTDCRWMHDFIIKDILNYWTAIPKIDMIFISSLFQALKFKGNVGFGETCWGIPFFKAKASTDIWSYIFLKHLVRLKTQTIWKRNWNVTLGK